MSTARRFASRRSGVALVAVLWIVAALSIMVTGMVQAQKDELRVVSSSRELASATGRGHAAVQLALQQMAFRQPPVSGLQRLRVNFEGASIPVEVVPLTGLIDLNRAPEPILELLFRVGGAMQADPAQLLAREIVSRRELARAANSVLFEAREDLLQLPGVGYDLYARLAPLVTTASLGGGRVNPLAAPETVLAVLTAGDAAQAARIAAGRDAGGTGADTSRLRPELVDNAVSTRYRLRATVGLPDGRSVAVVRVVELAPVAETGLPWRVLEAEERFEPAAAKDTRT